VGLLADRLDTRDQVEALLRDAQAAAEAELASVRELVEKEVVAWKGKSAGEAVAVLRRRAEADAARQGAMQAGTYAGRRGRLTAADRAVDSWVSGRIAKDNDLPRQELEARAEQTIDRILGGPDGRLPYDAPAGGPRQGPPGEQVRGSLNSRDFAIPSNLVQDYLENDVEHVLGVTMRTLLPDVALHSRFGDAEMTAVFKSIKEEFAAKIAAAKTPAERTALAAQRDRVERDLAAQRDRIRGVYGWSADVGARQAARLAQVAKAYNVVTDLGTAPLNSMGDLLTVTFRHAITDVLSDAWLPFFKGMITGDKAFSQSVTRELKAAMIAVETETNLRHRALSDVLDHYQPGSKFERGLAWMSDKSQLVNGQAWWTDRVKSFAGAVVMANILRKAERVADGRATAKDLAELAERNIDAATARRIWENFSGPNGGDKIDGVLVPNTGEWDQRVADVFRAATAREVDIGVITPGLEKPLFMSRPVASLLGQFKAFVAATHERVLLASLMKRDAIALQGVLATVAAGMLSYRLYAAVSGQEVSDRLQDWIKEGVARSGILGWLDEGNNITANVTSGRVDLYRAIGADRPLSRWSSRSVWGALLGPTAGKVEGVKQVIGAGMRGDWTAADTSRLRRLMPFQNLFYIRNLLNELEAGVNDALGVPPRTAAR
jgi:hypothetical protein